MQLRRPCVCVRDGLLLTREPVDNSVSLLQSKGGDRSGLRMTASLQQALEKMTMKCKKFLIIEKALEQQSFGERPFALMGRLHENLRGT